MTTQALIEIIKIRIKASADNPTAVHLLTEIKSSLEKLQKFEREESKIGSE